MNNALNNLPSVGQMFKLVIVLLFAVIAVGLVLAIVKMLLPVAGLAALDVGGYYLIQKMQNNR